MRIYCYCTKKQTSIYYERLIYSYAVSEGVGESWSEHPPQPRKNHKNIPFLNNTGLDPLKLQSYNVPSQSIQWRAIIVMPVRCYLNGVSLAGR